MAETADGDVMFRYKKKQSSVKVDLYVDDYTYAFLYVCIIVVLIVYAFCVGSFHIT